MELVIGIVIEISIIPEDTVSHLPVWPKSELEVASIRYPHLDMESIVDLWKYLLIYFFYYLFF